MKLAKWEEYEILSASNGEKVERWGNFILKRPDPQIMWESDQINEFDAVYIRQDTGGGYWDYKKKLPPFWNVKYKNLTFKVSPTGFKHTGLFPEQAVNWDFMADKIKKEKRKIKVLNLFAYTGGATLACSKAGAEVVHVDASKNIISWAKENAMLSNLEDNNIRYIVDDCLKFVEREARRESKYDAIVMDPPNYGRGPNGEMWKFEKNLEVLIDACLKILSDKPLFFIINAYTVNISSVVLHNILKTKIQKKYNGEVEAYEIGLPIKDGLILPCGITGKWEK